MDVGSPQVSGLVVLVLKRVFISVCEDEKDGPVLTRSPIILREGCLYNDNGTNL